MLDWTRELKAVTVAGLRCLGLFSGAFRQWHSVSLFADVIDCESETVSCISSALSTSPCRVAVSVTEVKYYDVRIDVSRGDFHSGE